MHVIRPPRWCPELPARRTALSALAALGIVAASLVTAHYVSAKPAPIAIDYSGDTAATARVLPDAAACQRSGSARGTGGWTINHFQWCRVSTFEYYAHLDNREGVPVHEATMSARVTILGLGSSDARTATMRVIIDDFQNNTDPIFEPGEIGINATCAPVGKCTTTPDLGWPSTPAMVRTGSLTSDFTVDSPAGSGAGRYLEDRVDATLTVRISATDPGGESHTDFPHPVRFDSAPYLAATRTTPSNGAIFPAMSYLTLDLNDPNSTDAVRHVYDALNNPALTLPMQPGKRIPGGSPDDPLHRIPDADPQKALNHTLAVRECQLIQPNYAASGLDCDEFPFQSTREGVAAGTGDFSVRPLNLNHNRSEGARLGAFYRADRLLDGDPFFIKFTGTYPVAPAASPSAAPAAGLALPDQPTQPQQRAQQASVGRKGTVMATPDVALRATAGGTAAPVTRIPGGHSGTVTCYAVGDQASGWGGTNNLWDKLTIDGHAGYIADVWLDTGGDITKQGVPTCS
jgi:Deoxyribonuclease NucA/NucB